MFKAAVKVYIYIVKENNAGNLKENVMADINGKTENKANAQSGETSKGNNTQQQAKQQAESLKNSSDELAKALQAAEDYKRKWYAVSAEYDNYRKRMATATSQAYADGKAEAILKLLPVADNFGYAYGGASDEKTKAGIEKIIKNFNNILLSLGVEEVHVAVGDDFDESVMEAVMNAPCGEGEEANKVSAVLKKGYKRDGKVIRFAQVAVKV